jgi:hypothetical protein
MKFSPAGSTVTVVRDETWAERAVRVGKQSENVGLGLVINVGWRMGKSGVVDAGQLEKGTSPYLLRKLTRASPTKAFSASESALALRARLP